MSRSTSAAKTKSRTRMIRRRRSRPRPRACSYAFQALLAAPLALQLVAGAIASLALWAAVNWVYHALHKPTELFFPVSSTLSKTPSETWREYGSTFRKYATAVIAPEFLAALAQVESAGNPFARTYWQWHPTWHPFELYGPASSAVGMYQITDGTFAQTKRECRYEPTARENDFVHGPRFGACWFDSLYTRIVPSHAIELTARLLDRSVAATLKHQRITTSTVQHKQDLAAVIHLCGTATGEAYARRGFRLTPGQRCGDHDVHTYLGRVNSMKRLFVRLASDS
jgi:hypothetical protein